MSNEPTDQSRKLLDRPTAQQSPTNEQAVTQIEERFVTLETGFNQNDPTMLDRLFTADAVVVVPDGTVVRGWEEIYAYHTARLESPANNWHTNYSIPIIMFPNEDIAVVHTRQTTTTPERTFTNHGTSVMIETDDEWWICAMQNTNVVDRSPEDGRGDPG
ncbi:YybH family protein [Halocatena marina]|uniref:YybH family protein n=1 Tax=Halocatena marina TaxID=2934937 RepID=A0ABD5YIS2_9EURY|nr:SgcJ/EcaC family oxidoreductase [Halocatena marina]